MQIAPLAIFEIQDQRIVRLQITRMIEVDDIRVVGQYVFENVHLARYATDHVVLCLLLAHQELTVAFPLDEVELALATFPNLSQLFVGFFGLIGTLSSRRCMGSAFMCGGALFCHQYWNRHCVRESLGGMPLLYRGLWARLLDWLRLDCAAVYELPKSTEDTCEVFKEPSSMAISRAIVHMSFTPALERGSEALDPHNTMNERKHRGSEALDPHNTMNERTHKEVL